ncbi:probable ribosome production factor 1 [Contarinia nasturtii]|uniref:probable ribosome production factor 1 n=1 Tax=Contarinia nasturtii TaxID=265458 RepID=UPI0012D40813|nr:probable ribosome production factor 1 [Contarinia nasturtii]
MSDTSDVDSFYEEIEPKSTKKKKTIKKVNGKWKETDMNVDEHENNENDENDGCHDNDEDLVNKSKTFRINPLNLIKNKDIRHKLFKKQQQAKKKEQKKTRKQRKLEGGTRSTGHTIESLREKDHTTVENLEDSDSEELRKELEIDDFSEYFAREYTPKVLITYADNPVTKTRKFGIELTRMIPNSLAKIRNRSSIKKMVKSAIRENFTDIIIINENNREPNGLVVVHLPNGPTAHFKLSNVRITKEINRSHLEFTKHRPEVILTNFTTRLGLSVGRMLGALFHHDPEFKGRRAVTFHNQRDYIFFRHHRYEFAKDGSRAKLRELGPRFTLKLRSLQEGTFDSKYGDYDWMITNKRHSMEGRRRFFL